MQSRSTRKEPHRLTAAIALLVLLGAAQPASAQTVYNIAGLSDFTGPYADIMKDVTACRRAVVDWWSDEIGKPMGITLRIKDYDTRYDTAQTASLWPGIKSELSPVVTIGLGGPDVTALRERLPADKIPLILGTAAYGFGWKPDPWIFNPRATYPHEAAAFFEWYRKKRGGDAPLKVGVIASEASPAYVDIAKGVERYARDNPRSVELVETVFADVQPADLTTQVGRLLRKGVEVIYVPTNTAAVVATKRALQALGKPQLPVLVSAHNSLPVSAKVIGGLAQMEGSYEVYGMAIPTDEQSKPRQFFEKLRDKYQLKANYNVPCLMGIDATLVSVRAVEAAARKVGATHVTGAAVRQALLSTPITVEQTFGQLPTLRYGEEGPFPISGMTVNIGSVRGGAYVLAEQNVPVPTLNKW